MGFRLCDYECVVSLLPIFVLSWQWMSLVKEIGVPEKNNADHLPPLVTDKGHPLCKLMISSKFEYYYCHCNMALTISFWVI